MKGFVKDPDSTLDYSLDWTLWLDGDTISNSTWIVESPLVSTNEAFDTVTTRLFLSGGVAGESYLVTNQITTAGGLTDERSFEIRVRQR